MVITVYVAGLVNTKFYRLFFSSRLFFWYRTSGWFYFIFLGSKRRIAFSNEFSIFIYVKPCTTPGTGLIPLKVKSPTHLSDTAFRTNSLKHELII
jgi:hypothetical protein